MPSKHDQNRPENLEAIIEKLEKVWLVTLREKYGHFKVTTDDKEKQNLQLDLLFDLQYKIDILTQKKANGHWAIEKKENSEIPKTENIAYKCKKIFIEK